MRKAQIRQAAELAKQIEQAHEQIKKYIEQGNAQLAMELLKDCQNGGITIGTLIEETEGEGHPTVSMLEDYCELTYQIYTDLENNKEINANKIYKLLKQKLIKTSNSLKNDIQIKKEAVFLPYKASMWDSLESVWKAADEDPNCDAYVIPIPYYDKNPDGSFREMHYEGDQYPDYVPITKYDEFDFGMHQPDMIYIHNPYDGLNFVTSVHPFFFSENLKKFTNKLIYIPYFILDEIKPDEDAKIEGMKHFCTTPGVLNADKVIVQSEDMKQIYVKVLMKATNNQTEAAKKYWNDKILGLGSPKIDKMLNMKKADLGIPQEWLKMIQKPDGSRKRIVFYNTSIAALLQYNEKMLEKMENVFKIFKENRKEITLLWRPHPLIKATVESMRPQLWLEYDKLVRKYQEEGWGIYDDTSDVDRAIALSDAYYGDWSSVVQLYRQISRNTLIQNVNAVSSMMNKDIYLNFRGYVRTENTLYFANMEFNCLFAMSLDTYEITYIHTFSGMSINKFFCVGQYIMSYQDKLIFFPNIKGQHKLWCYDLKTRVESEIDFPGVAESTMISCYTFVRENKGWIIPTDMSSGVYVMDLDTLHIKKDETMSSVLREYNYGRRCKKQDEKSFSFVDENKNELIVVNVDTGSKTSFKLPVQDICGFAMNEKSVWMVQTGTTDVYEWDLERNILQKYVLLDEELWNKSDVPYIDLIYVKEHDCVFLLGCAIGHILKTNRATQTIEVAFDFPKGFRFLNNKLSNYSYFAEVECIDGELWFYPIRGNMILVYDIRKNTVRGIKSMIHMQDIPQFKEIMLCEMKESVCNEYEGVYCLQNMLQTI